MHTPMIRRRPELAWPGRRFSALLRSTAGVSAVEFALVAPVLVLGCIGTVDVGTAVYQRMMINQALRAAAQPAFDGADESTVRTVLQKTAEQNFSVADGTPSGNQLAIDVESSCACPGDAVAGVSCGSTCATGSEALRFFRLSATKGFEGLILPDLTLSGSLEVIQR